MKHSVSGEAKAGFSEACERNKRPLMDVLKNAFAECRRIVLPFLMNFAGSKMKNSATTIPFPLQ